MTCEGGGSLEIYLEPVLPKPELIIVGRSPVAQIISDLARLLDFKVTLADPEATKEQFPAAELILTDLAAVRHRINEASFVVVATMGNGDEEGLQAVVGSSPKYLGLVASKKKAGALFDYARCKGATGDQIALIKCPAGIELGSETLPEIALSVMAEITRVRRTRSDRTVELPVTNSKAPGEVTDPICGMTVDVETARYRSVVADNTYFFCCLRCKETFDQGHPQISQITQTGQK